MEGVFDGSIVEKAISIAMESIPEDGRDPEKIAANTQIIGNFLKGLITQEDASAHFLEAIGTDEPIKRLDAFMKTLNPQPVLQNLKLGGPGYRKTPNRWTKEEDQRLIAAVQIHGTENWPAVAACVGNRTRSQCSQRWNRGLDPRISKQNWSQEEEIKLLETVKQFGNKAWTRIAQEMGNRSDVQCRFRYNFLEKKAKESGTDVQPISAPEALAHAMNVQPTEVPCILENDQSMEVFKGDAEPTGLALPQPKE